MKKFIYLVQSEKGLRKNLNKLYGPDSDVLLLTWRKPITNAIFFPLSTWTEGINRLYQEVFKTNYLYYVFVDDDVVLKTTELCKNHTSNPWRIFERNLLKFLPAIGVPRLNGYKKSQVETEFTCWFDAISMAIQREALKVLFPLYDGEDTESWWNSGIYFRHESTMLYPNHILQFNTIEAINQEHRLYPKNLEWERIDNNFKASIRDNKLKKSFRPLRHLSPSLNGRVGKNLSYTYKQEKLSRLFDFNNKIFKRRFTVNKNIADGEPYAVCDRSRLPYLGEYISKNWGTKVAAFIFGPLVVLFELKKKIFLIVIKTKEIIHEYVGAILETTRSWRHLLGLRRNIGNTTTMETIDKIIIQHGSNEDNFFIIQIGSNDGCTGDPIHKFVKHYKWKGVFVEPVPYIYKRLKNTYKDYNGLIFENVAINIKDGYRTFYRIKKNNEPNNPIWYDQLGSFKKAIVEKHRNEIPNFDKHLIRERVRCLSVGSLFNKYNISKIDLLHIDAEGYDFKIIKQVPFSYIKPGMILYECQNLSQSDNQKCEKLLKDQGYRLLSTGKDTFAYMPLG